MPGFHQIAGRLIRDELYVIGRNEGSLSNEMLMLIIHRFLILKVCMQKQCAATMKQMLRTSAGHGVQGYHNKSVTGSLLRD
jgi:hypothetical protein